MCCRFLKRAALPAPASTIGSVAVDDEVQPAHTRQSDHCAGPERAPAVRQDPETRQQPASADRPALSQRHCATLGPFRQRPPDPQPAWAVTAGKTPRSRCRAADDPCDMPGKGLTFCGKAGPHRALRSTLHDAKPPSRATRHPSAACCKNALNQPDSAPRMLAAYEMRQTRQSGAPKAITAHLGGRRI